MFNKVQIQYFYNLINDNKRHEELNNFNIVHNNDCIKCGNFIDISLFYALIIFMAFIQFFEYWLTKSNLPKIKSYYIVINYSRIWKTNMMTMGKVMFLKLIQKSEM